MEQSLRYAKILDFCKRHFAINYENLQYASTDNEMRPAIQSSRSRSFIITFCLNVSLLI